jgi:hypothetical protein
LKFAGKFSSFCFAFKRKKINVGQQIQNKRWPTNIKQMKKALANRESVLSFTFTFSTEKCRNDTSCLEQLF